MRPFGLILLVLFASTLCVEDEFPIENDLTVLTDDTFDKAIAQYDNIMVLFYAPWCGHCKKFKPQFEKASATLRKENLICAKVDATENKKLADRFKIRGYPTIKFFKKGEQIDYNGGRKDTDVINWMRKKSGPATRTLGTAEEVEKFQKDNEVGIVYFGTDKEELKEYTTVAMKIDDYPFAVVENEDLIKKFSKAGTVVLYKHFDEKKNEISTIKAKEIEDFINLYSYPRVLTFDEKATQLIFGSAKPCIALFADEKKSDKWEEYKKLLTALHPKLSEKKLKIVLSDMKDGMAKRVAEYVGVKEADMPCVRIFDTRSDLKKYVMEGEINEQNILKFAEDWEAKKLKVYLKSQEEPKENKEDVLVVVGKSFEKEVINNDKDVMLLFYAPWCGHCKALHPKYEEAAKLLKAKNPKVVLAKIDATENEVESVHISGFPTVKFYPGNKKDKAPIDFNGDRTTEGIIKFLKENCYNKLDYEEPKKEEEKKEDKSTDKKKETDL